MELTTWILLEIALIGLAAGVLGGLAGVGGSMIMLPAMHWLMGEPRDSVHHLYVASAMAVNIAVALPSAWRHNKSGSVRTDMLLPLMVSTILGVIVGVLAGNLMRGDSLRVGLAGFLLCYCGFNAWRLLDARREAHTKPERADPKFLAFSGGVTGLTGGLLGLGGGVMLVPLLQMLVRIQLKQAIATSSAVIWLSAVVGAGVKIGTLSGEGERWQDALLLAGLLTPTAVAGGIAGAALTQRLPVRTVRVVITLLLLIASARLLHLF